MGNGAQVVFLEFFSEYQGPATKIQGFKEPSYVGPESLGFKCGNGQGLEVETLPKHVPRLETGAGHTCGGVCVAMGDLGAPAVTPKCLFSGFSVLMISKGSFFFFLIWICLV